MSQILKFLKPIDINHRKIRLGPNEDGGYITSSVVLEDCSALFSYGISSEYRFETDFSNKYHKPVYMFDHTSKIKNVENLFFFKEGLGFKDKCKDFLEHYKQFKISGKVILKIDIEGNEYDYFLKTKIDDIPCCVNGINIEFHCLNKKNVQDKFIRIMNKLTMFFSLYHIHGNNYGGGWEYDGFFIPNTIEMSLINRKLTQIEKKKYRRLSYRRIGFSKQSPKTRLQTDIY